MKNEEQKNDTRSFWKLIFSISPWNLWPEADLQASRIRWKNVEKRGWLNLQSCSQFSVLI